MYIPSSKKDVVLALVISFLTISLALTLNSRRIARDELEITKFKLFGCEDSLKRKTDHVERLKNELIAGQANARENRYKTEGVSNKVLPILAQYTAITEMLMRRIKNGEISESMIREYDGILKQ